MSAGAAAALVALPRPLLLRVLQSVACGELECPITEEGLVANRLGSVAGGLVAVLGGLDANAVRVVIDAVLAERGMRPASSVDLVWSGPEANTSVSRDTARVLTELFDSAEQSAIVAGYAFDEPEILAPLHRAMAARGVRATVFVDIKEKAPKGDEAAAMAVATASIDRFLRDVWTFGEPRPDLYYDPRTAQEGPPWSSLHAKCVVVDDRRALVTSANFTARGQTRNIEVGAHIDDVGFATELASQWRGLIAAGLVRRYTG